MLKLLKNEYIYSVITKIITMAIALLQSVLVFRYLGAALQGSLTYIVSIVSVGAIVITFGMHQAYPYLKKEMGKEAIYDDFISIIVLLFTIYFVVALGISFFFSSIELKTAVILIPVYGYDRVVAYITLIESPNARNRWWTIASIIDILFVLFLYFMMRSSILSVVLILTFCEVLKSVIYTILLRPKVSFKNVNAELLKELFIIGFFPMLALLLTTLNYKIDILMLKNYPLITREQIGVYSIGMNFADKIVLIPDTLKGVLVSKLSKGANEDEVAKVSRLCFVVSFLLCILLIILGEPIISLLYGKDSKGAYDILLICSFGSVFVGYFKLIAQYNIVNKKQIRNVVMLTFSVIINVILNLLLIPRYNLCGAAFASGVGYFLSGIIFVVWFAIKYKIGLYKMFLIQKEDLNALKKIFKKGQSL